MSADDSSEGGIPKYFKSIRMAIPGTTDDVTNPGALPAKDSWIALDPGTEFELNAKTQEEWLEKAQKFRRVRGNFLAASFDLEYTIDSIVNEIFFPTPRCESAENLKRLFDEIFLKSPTRSFGRKITLLERLLKELPTLASLVPKESILDLKEIVQMRNGFAHFPIIFKPVETSNEKTIVPLLALRYPPLPLDESFFEKYGRLIPKVASVLSNALTALSHEKTGSTAAAVDKAESAKGNTGPVYLGHGILNVDTKDWMLE